MDPRPSLRCHFSREPDRGITPGHAAGEVLCGGEHNYTILRPIGSGASGFTYEAEYSSSDGSKRKVAIKALSLSRMTSWKQLDLFERESGMLKSISHPSVPRYLDYFETQSESDLSWYLVQELAPGRSLGASMRANQRLELDEVRAIARRLLSVLDYLGTLSPPVVHRDLKPDNIVYDPKRSEESSGGVYVVDFGGVQSVDVDRDMPGTTMMVGTYGFMPPEQFQGRATAKSDLYGLGATLLTLITGKSPSSFPQSRLKIDFSSESIPLDLERIISGLLEPVEEDRISAREALRILDSKNSASDRTGDGVGDISSLPFEGEIQDKDGRLSWFQDEDTLVVNIRPKGLDEETVSVSTFTITWNAFIFVWTRLALLGANPLLASFSLPFWTAGFKMGRQTFQEFYRALVGTELTLTGDNFRLVKDLIPPTVRSNTLTGKLRSKLLSKLSSKLQKRLRSVRGLTRKEFIGDMSQLRVGEIVQLKVSRDGNDEPKNVSSRIYYALEIYVRTEGSLEPEVIQVGEGLSKEELVKLRRLLKERLKNAIRDDATLKF